MELNIKGEKVQVQRIAQIYKEDKSNVAVVSQKYGRVLVKDFDVLKSGVAALQKQLDKIK